MPEERGEYDRQRDDEDAVWAQLVAAFDEEPAAERTWPAAEELDGGLGGGLDGELYVDESADDDDEGGPEDDSEDQDDDKGRSGDDSGVKTVHGVVMMTGALSEPSAPGPRDYTPADDDDEGHFVPPPPPPLPEVDATTRFAWVAVLGGPLLLFLMVVLQQPVTWWMIVLGVGGFLGGFATLVARMKDHDEDDPHGGAVV